MDTEGKIALSPLFGLEGVDAQKQAEQWCKLGYPEGVISSFVNGSLTVSCSEIDTSNSKSFIKIKLSGKIRISAATDGE